MILWCDGAHDARENMRLDAALLDAADAHGPGAEAVLRLFRFEPAGITLGRGQEPRRELDLERCVRDGVTWAVRPTGGRAIFHADEWTYSLVAPLADPEWGGSLTAAYNRVARLLLAGLHHLGVPAELSGGGPRTIAPRERQGPAVPCFATTTRHEIVRDGRKLVGSAQRRAANALLQQGSLLLSDRHLELVEYLALPDESRRGAREALRQASTHIGDVVGAGAPLDLWADSLTAVLPPETRRARAFPLTA